jgi:hypothetical protein
MSMYSMRSTPPRSMEHSDLDVTKVEDLSISHCMKRVLGIGAFVQHVFGARCLCKSARARNVIRVKMCIDHVPNIQVILLRYTDVQIRIINGVAHGALRPAASTENVRSGNNGLSVEQLT